MPGTSRQADNTRFELNRLTRHIVQPRGDVARISVAVIVDDDHVLKAGSDGSMQTERVPRTADELKKIHGLVAAAVGLNNERGDQVTVENVAFDEPLVEPAQAPTALERYAPQIEQGIRVVVILGVVLAIVLLVVRPAMRATGLMSTASRKEVTAQPLPAVSVHAPRTVAELESEIEAQIDAAAEERANAWRRTPVLMRKVANVSKSEPQQVAKLLRTWIAEEGR
jgi:flagellar M-ring protein FliF